MPHMPIPGPTHSWAEVGRGHSDSRYGFEETVSQDGAADRCTKFLGSPSGFRTLWDTGYSQGYEIGLEMLDESGFLNSWFMCKLLSLASLIWRASRSWISSVRPDFSKCAIDSAPCPPIATA